MWYPCEHDWVVRRRRERPYTGRHPFGATSGLNFEGCRTLCGHTQTRRNRLHMSNGKVRGGDASLCAQFKHVAGRGGMALCAEQGFGADLFEAVWMWEDAVTAYLKEEKNPWYTECRSTRWKPGPAERRELTLSAIRPQHDKRHCIEDEAGPSQQVGRGHSIGGP